MSKNNDYKINFFKPRTPHAKSNMKIIITMVIIWGTAVFGFHFLLGASINKVPEPAYDKFISIWHNIADGKASVHEKQELINVLFTAMTKPMIGEVRTKLNRLLTWTVSELIPVDKKVQLKKLIDGIAYYKNKLENWGKGFKITKEQKDKVVKELNQKIDANIKEISKIVEFIAHIPNHNGKVEFVKIKEELLIRSMVPIEEDKKLFEELSECKDDTNLIDEIKKWDPCMPNIMKRLLVHNRSVLTDTKFLGFPFHYWYTAEFLLILFVLLCWSYCFLIGRLNKKYNVKEDAEEERS